MFYVGSNNRVLLFADKAGMIGMYFRFNQHSRFVSRLLYRVRQNSRCDVVSFDHIQHIMY